MKKVFGAWKSKTWRPLSRTTSSKDVTQSPVEDETEGGLYDLERRDSMPNEVRDIIS